MTDVLCTGCGATLGTLEEFDEGDSVTCEGCDSTFDFVENENPAYDAPRMVETEESRDGPPEPEIAEIEGVSDGVVTWVRGDGTRVRDPVDDFPGDLPDSLTNEQ